MSFEATGSVSPKPAALQCLTGSAALVADQEDEDRARAHQREAPVVVEDAALEGLVVGVAGDLVVAVGERRVALDDGGDLAEDVFAAPSSGCRARCRRARRRGAR